MEKEKDWEGNEIKPTSMLENYIQRLSEQKTRISFFLR